MDLPRPARALHGRKKMVTVIPVDREARCYFVVFVLAPRALGEERQLLVVNVGALFVAEK